MDAFDFGNDCIQKITDDTPVFGSEDCLYLNVYVPANGLLNNEKLTVMVFIYGGGFYFGTSSFYGPHLLIDQNVIIVSEFY